MKFLNFGIKGKFITVCALLSCFTVAIGLVGFFSIRTIIQKYDIIASSNLPNTRHVGDLLAFQRKYRNVITRLGFTGLTGAERKELWDKAADVVALYQKSDKDYNDIPFGPGEEDRYKPVNASWKEIHEMGEKMIELSKSSDSKDFEKLRGMAQADFQAVSDKYGPLTAKLIEYHADWAKRAVAEAKQASTLGNTLSLFGVILGFFVSMTLGTFISRALTKKLSEVADALSNGASQVASASTEVSSASDSLSTSATEQAAAIQETAASVEEIGATIRQNAENSKRSAEISEASRGVANEGQQIVQQVILTISEINQSNHEINQQVEQSNAELAEIVKVISDIGSKTKVINDIVFQTKLLSFNASVEAARAGEHGKGFSVVAEEVGNLAQMSGNAAREITEMLDGSIKRVESIVHDTRSKIEGLMSTSKEKVQKGSEVAKNCGDVLGRLVENVNTVNQMVAAISAASQEQSNGVNEINKAIGQLDEVTQQNASAAQQSAGASTELSRQAEEMRTTVTLLLSIIQGGVNSADTYVSKQIETRVEPKPTHVSAKAKDESQLRLIHPEPKKAETKAASNNPVPAGVPDENDPRFKTA